MPDNNKKESGRKKLLALHNNYRKKLPEKIELIENIRDQIIINEYNEERCRTLHNLLHNLAGAGETFGFHNIGKAARDGELLLKLILDSRGTGDWKKEIDERVSRLGTICKKVLKKKTEQLANLLPGSAALGDHWTDNSDKRLIFLVEDDAEVAEHLAVQVEYYGYRSRLFRNLDHFRKAMENIEPLAVIMDIRMPDGNSAEIMENIQKARDMPMPVIFISVLDGLKTRLQAVRAGGVAYFRKPVDPARLIDILNSLIAGTDPEPYRILIVDDSESLSQYISMVLEKAGMETGIVTDPLKIMEPLNELQPDLILMDLYMPGCSGMELAKVIRQQEAFVSIPIVYLSGETDAKRRIEAMNLGGDDFLTKPITPGHLVPAVASRARRARILRSFMERDSLTGLLNHTRTKERLDLEVERAKRQQGQLAFAMIDIDKFKAVNDTYGHPTGDRVLKSIARMLKQRLRKTDVVGRYGGEEFAVILSDTDGMNAKKVMNELRTAFCRIKHCHEDTEFNVTFSCGVAAFPACPSAACLNEAADKALYEAKRGGRNRVVLAE